MMNVSYAETSNIAYVKQQQQDEQMWPSSIKTRVKYSLLIWLVQAKTMSICKACKEVTKISMTCIWNHREMTRVQCNDNPNRCWLLRWRHETSGKPNWTTDVRLEVSKSNSERNDEDSFIRKWKYNKESAIRTNTRRLTHTDLMENFIFCAVSNVFARIAAVNGLPNFISPNDALSHKGEQNTEISLHTPTSRFLLSVIGDHYGISVFTLQYFIIYTHM